MSQLTFSGGKSDGIEATLGMVKLHESICELKSGI